MTDPLHAALEAHRHGFTPTPLHPSRKSPVLPGWPTVTFDSGEEVRETWTTAAEPYGSQPLNLGLSLGASHGGLVDIDLDHPRAHAVAARVLPHTPMRSGRPGNPGSHYWYVVDGYDPGICAYKLPSGEVIMEFRAGGGQTAVPPSLHPGGDTYHWTGEPWGGESGPTRLDADGGKRLHLTVMLIALTVVLADNWPRSGSRHAAYLPLVGGLLRDADEEGNPQAHPFWDAHVEALIHMLVNSTNDTDGGSTRVAESVHTTRKKIARGDRVQGWPTLAQIIGEDHVAAARDIIAKVEELADAPRAKVKRGAEAEWYDESPALRVVAHDERAGETPEERDVRVAEQQALLRSRPDAERDPLEERIYQWEPLDLTPYLRGGVKPTPPGVLLRDDDKGLFYPGRVNSLFGEGGSGKTLVALDTAAKQIRAGETVLFVDFEDEPVNIIERLHALGLDDDEIADRFIYLHPEGQPLAVMHFDRYGQPIEPRNRPQDRVFDELLASRDPSLVIVDGTTSLYRIHGLDTNGVQGTDLVGGWLRRLTNSNRRTVILIDHTAKSAGVDSGPIGSQHKIAMIQGVALRVQKQIRPRPGIKGEATLLVLKDRLGKVVEHSSEADTPVAAHIVYDSTVPGKLTITYGSPKPEDSGLARIIDSRGEAMLTALVQWSSANLGDIDAQWKSSDEAVMLSGTSFTDSERDKASLPAKMLSEFVDRPEQVEKRYPDWTVETNGKRTRGKKWRAVPPSL